MKVQLVLSNGNFKGKEFAVREGTNLVGRWDPETSSFPEIDLDEVDEDAKVSRKHAIIKKTGDTLVLRDMGSLNGTYLNRSDRLEEGKEYPLKPGDEIIIGKLFLRMTVS